MARRVSPHRTMFVDTCVAVLWWCCCWSNIVRGFNLEPRIPVLKLGDRGTYFGYSVAEHQILETESRSVRENVLLVGSPRASTSQPGTNHSGAVYRCPISTLPKDCWQINVENYDGPPDETELKNDQWLGVTLKSQGAGGHVLTCAHRFILRGRDFQWGLGLCHSLTEELEWDRTWEPCHNRDYSKAHESFAYCQAGASSHISEDNELLIGAPGPYTWRGMVLGNSITFGMRDDRNWFSGPIPNDEVTVEKYSYLGMAVTSGRFFNNETTYVGGATRGNGTGQVVFLKKYKTESLSRYLIHMILNGEQFASSYGYSLLSMDINSDGYVDLLVGAPFYYSKGQGGAVYIYMNSEEGINETTEPLKLTGKSESQFGLSLTSLGDLNKDGYPDLAIGAPYEGKGAVYIYLGSAEGLITEPSQVIRTGDLAKQSRVKRDVSTFGYSLSGGLDLDRNGYPDLLVGSYESDSVILLRSRPIIDIITSVEGNLTNIDPKAKGCIEDRNATLVCFSFETCFHFNSSVLSDGTSIKIRYRIEAETFTGKKYYRVKFRSSLESETPNIVEKDINIRGESLTEPHCSKELVYLKEKTDIQSPIKFKMTYTLIQKVPKMVPEGNPLPDINQYPILNQQEASKVFEAKFLKMCGTNDICESDLHVTAELILPKQETGIPVLNLGEQQPNLSIVLYNYREPAYDTALYVTHASTLSYIGRKVVKGDQVECIPFNSTVLECEIGNPMNAGEVEFQIRFSPRNVSDDQKRLKFVLKANTTSIEVTPEEDLVLFADVMRVAELELRGGSNPEQVVYGEHFVAEKDMKSGEDIGSLVIHTYELINYGPWKAKEVEVHVYWPYQIESFRKHEKWLLYMMETPKVQGNGYCDLDPGIVNPLHLKIKREEDPFIRDYMEPKNEREVETRTKRQAPEEIRMDRPMNVATMDCEKGMAKCYFFKCVFRDIHPDRNALISIRSRLWTKTFVDDYANVDRVDIISKANIYINPDLDIHQKSDNDVYYVKTQALPDLPLYQKPEMVPLWIIILAVCGGLFLLILLIFCLWKLGFFKRTKPGYVVAETSEKEKEFNNI